MAALIATDPLVEKLMKIEGKAEIIGGEIIEWPPSGAMPSYAAGAIGFSLHHAEFQSNGRVGSRLLAFLSPLPQGRSFTPDVSFWVDAPGNDPFGPIPHPPVFAVEVRSENDYGRRAELAISQKKSGITSRRVLWWSGMSICETKKASPNIPLKLWTTRRSSGAAKSPMRATRLRVGR